MKKASVPVKTPVAARLLHVPYTRLMSLLRHGKIPAPSKDSSGDYQWSQADLVAARRFLGGQPEEGRP